MRHLLGRDPPRDPATPRLFLTSSFLLPRARRRSSFLSPLPSPTSLAVLASFGRTPPHTAGPPHRDPPSPAPYFPLALRISRRLSAAPRAVRRRSVVVTSPSQSDAPAALRTLGEHPHPPLQLLPAPPPSAGPPPSLSPARAGFSDAAEPPRRRRRRRDAPPAVIRRRAARRCVAAPVLPVSGAVRSPPLPAASSPSPPRRPRRALAARASAKPTPRSWADSRDWAGPAAVSPRARAASEQAASRI
jgi:hypothetical protein